MTLTPDERAYLRLYTPRTHGIELPRDLAKSMEDKGWVEWVLPNFGSHFGSSALYSITEAGKKVLGDVMNQDLLITDGLKWKFTELVMSYLTILGQVSISMQDGSMKFEPGYSPSAAANQFWEAVSQEYRDMLKWKADQAVRDAEIARLRKILDD
jgi:hypothetical protein